MIASWISKSSVDAPVVDAAAVLDRDEPEETLELAGAAQPARSAESGAARNPSSAPVDVFASGGDAARPPPSAAGERVERAPTRRGRGGAALGAVGGAERSCQ